MTKTSRLLPGLLAAAAFAILPAVAPLPVQASETTSANQVAETYAKLLEENYVFADVGTRFAAALRSEIEAGRFAALSGEDLARALDATVQTVAHDGHMRVHASIASWGAPGGAGSRPWPSPIEQAGWIAPGIAYVRFNVFPAEPETVAAAGKFMAAHADAKAIIFDIRTHAGGGLGEMDVIFPWLFAEPTRLVTMAMRSSVDARGGFPIGDAATMRRVEGDPAMVSREHWAIPNGDARLRDARIFVLTSGASRSAAEHFALAMKHTGRGTLIGEATGGANHFGGGEELGGGFGAFIPVGRTYDPLTGKDWEGTGVEPDIEVPAADALVRALTELDVETSEAKRLAAARHPSMPMERRRKKPAASAG